MVGRRRSWRILSSIVAVCCAALVASCGAAPSPLGGSGGQQLGAIHPWGGDFSTEGQPKRGGTLKLGMTGEIVSFDPTVSNGNSVATAVYDTLLKFSPQGGVEPYMAESMESPDNGLTWVLKLRPGVRFHDGTTLDANAVMINVQRHIDKVRSPAHDNAQRIKAMRVLDPLTLEFSLKEPMGEFPTLFALSFVEGTLGMIISPAALAKYGDDIGRHPVGAGPFKFVEWVPDSRTVVTRNTDYWQPGLPYLDTLEFRPLSDTESRYASIVNGDVDVIFAGYNQELVRGLADPNLEVYYGPGDGGEFLRFNFNQPPFDDRRMREAIIRSINLDALAASQYNNQFVPANSLFDVDSPYHTKAASDAWPTFDPEKAKQLIDEYRASGGDPNFTFKTTNSRVAFAEFIQAQMAAVGVQVDLEFYDIAQYTASVIQSNDFQLSTWVGEVNSAFPGVGRLLRSDGSANHGRYSNPQVDQLIDEARVTTDQVERTGLYQQIELISGQDLALAWFSRTYRSTIVRKDVNGIDRYPLGTTWFATTWLDR